MDSNDELMQVEDVAQHFAVSTHAVYKWARQERIRSVRLGRAVRIPRSEFEYIKQHGLREPATIADNRRALVTALPC